MSSIIIACNTIENELTAAMRQCSCSYDVHWIESGLHNVPKKLHDRLQEALNSCTNNNTVLLAMGLCGNSVNNLHTGDFQLVIPRVDDCISLLLGSMQKRKEASENCGTYFMTEGWLKGERNIWREYEYAVQKFGEEMGKEIFDTMFRHYRCLALVNTGCFDCEAAVEKTKTISEKLNLEFRVLSGTIDYLIALLSGNWSANDFIVIPPNSTTNEVQL